MNVSKARKKNHCLHMKIGVDSCYVFHNIECIMFSYNMNVLCWMYLVSEFEIPDNFFFFYVEKYLEDQCINGFKLEFYVKYPIVDIM